MRQARSIDRILADTELLPRQPAGPLLAFSLVEASEGEALPLGHLGDLAGLLAVFRRGVEMLIQEVDEEAMVRDLRALDRVCERAAAALDNPSALTFLIPGLTDATLRLGERLVDRRERMAADEEAIELGQLLVEAAPTLAALLRRAAGGAPAPAALRN